MYKPPQDSSHQGITLTPGLLICDRYKIVSVIGRGGFGRTYLAQDQNRFNEQCVLKEFAPQIQNQAGVQKAQDLFEQEAGVLYRLEHPQIPKFREFLRTYVNGHYYLLLVQDYVKGTSYSDLLKMRSQSGQAFSEAEALQLLRGILPVLSYLHSHSVIHRDISPDNLMLRERDGLPVLIDFGGVKQVMLTILSQVAGDSSLAATALGKVGYAPGEQMQQGFVWPNSDLYGLAMTTLVLLTGQEPQLLRDPSTLTLQWQRYTQMSAGLAQVLERMLALKPSDRFGSADAVLIALRTVGGGSSPSMHTVSSTMATQVVAPANGVVTTPVGGFSPAAPRVNVSTSPSVGGQQPSKSAFPLGCLVGGLVGTGLTVVAIALGIAWLSQNSNFPVDGSATPTLTATPEPSYELSAEEIQRKAKQDAAVGRLGIDRAFFAQLVNELFYRERPELKGRSLTRAPEDAALREEWDRFAAEWLDRLKVLSLDALKSMGQYTETKRQGWKAELQKLNLSYPTLRILTDARFSNLFSDIALSSVNDTPLEQVWFAFASEMMEKIRQDKVQESLRINNDLVNGSSTIFELQRTVDSEVGKVFIIPLQADQNADFSFNAPTSVQWSLISPTSTVLVEGSTAKSWSGRLTEEGYYEFVVTSRSNTAEDFSLTVNLSKVSSTSTP
jgi:serine/threonine protein kinase, bacterial